MDTPYGQNRDIELLWGENTQDVDVDMQDCRTVLKESEANVRVHHVCGNKCFSFHFPIKNKVPLCVSYIENDLW